MVIIFFDNPKMQSMKVINDDKGITRGQMTSLLLSSEDEEKCKEIRTLTGLSDHMILIYIMMNSDDKSGQELEYVYWPNTSVKSLGKKSLELALPFYEEQKKVRAEANHVKLQKKNPNDAKLTKTPTTPKKPSDEDITRFILNSRRKEIENASLVEIDSIIEKIKSKPTITPSLRNRDDDNEEEEEEEVETMDYETYCPWNYDQTDNQSMLINDNILHNNEHSAMLSQYAHKRDCILMNEFVGWGVNKLGCYLFVYYIGPIDKGIGNCELKFPKNWRVVPKNHLDIFHKHINGYYTGYLEHTNMDNKESPYLPRHLSYDPRFNVTKWQKCKSNAKHFDMIMKNQALFKKDGPTDDYYIKVKKKLKGEKKNDASIEEVIESPFSNLNDLPSSSNHHLSMKKKTTRRNSASASLKKKLTTFNTTNTLVKKEEGQCDDKDALFGKETDIDSHRRQQQQQPSNDGDDESVEVSLSHRKSLMNIGIANYPDLTYYPLGRNIKFDLESFTQLLTHIETDDNEPPVEWEPIKLIEAFAIANNPEHQARRLVSTFFHIDNVSFDNFDAAHLLDYMHTNKEAIAKIHDETYQMIYSNMIFDFLTRDEKLDHLTRKPFGLLK
jgi:hypothetical protein